MAEKTATEANTGGRINFVNADRDIFKSLVI
jgi:hypothetical protein